MDLDTYDTTEQFTPEEDGDEEIISPEEIESEFKDAKDIELETALEPLEEQEVADDPVRLYLQEIGRSAKVIPLIQEQLNLTPTDKFKDSIADPKLCHSIQDVLDQQIVQAIAAKTGDFLPDVEQMLIHLSLNCTLLPKEVLDAIGNKVLLNDLEELVTKEKFIKTIQAHEKQIEEHLKHVQN